jgi:hypothetical protein
VRVAHAEHGRQPDALVAAQHRRQRGREGGAPLGVVEAPRQPDRVRVGALDLELHVDRARGDPGVGEVGSAQRGVEVAQHARAHDADRLAGASVAVAHRLGHERGRAHHADRGGQQVVALQAADVAIARVRTLFDLLGEPLQRRADRLGADERVGVIGMRRDELGEAPLGLLDAVGRVADDVDRAGRQVRRPDALGQDAHARAALGQSRRRREPRGARADDDRVEVQLASHAVASRCASGRWRTSRTPWKIQSSSRTWRT